MRHFFMVSTAMVMAFSVSGVEAAEQTAAADGISIESIIVTAERTNRTLRDTTSSVAVLTARDAAERALQSTYDILDAVPNFVANRSANNAPAVRGIDGGGPNIAANAFFAGARPRLAFQVDGRTLTFNEAVYLDGGIWDAQQIEVYRGPQSTLQGRNAIGGVVAIKTADPTFEWNGKARVQIGEDHLRQYSAAVGGPIVDGKLAFRVSTDHRNEEAFVTTFPYTELAKPGRYGLENYRGKLLFTPTDDIRSLATISYTDAYAPQTLSVKQPYTDYIATAIRSPRFRTQALVGISDTTWQVTDQIGLSALFTATDFRVNRYINPGNGIAQIDGTEYTAEPRVRFGQAGDTFTGFLAAFVFDADQHEVIDLFGGGAFDDSTLTAAVFGEATWRALENLELTFGARYESEERDRVGSAGSFVINFHDTYKVFLPKGTVKYNITPETAVGVTVGKGYNSGGAGFAFNPPFPSYQYDKETVWNYEAFIRSSLLDGSLQLTGNVFFNDYDNLQLPFVVAVTAAGESTVIRNAERATTYGAEAEARYRVNEYLDLRGSFGLLETKINRYSDPLAQGKNLPRAPAFSSMLGVTVRPIENLDASLDWRYTDAYYSDVLNKARGKTKPYSLVNAKIGYQLPHARLFGEVSNLFDEKTPVLRSPGVTPTADIANMTRPRRFTAGIELSF